MVPVAFGASVIDRHVQPAEAREGIINKFLDVLFLAHIRPHKLRFRAEISELDDKLLSLFIVTARNDNLCRFFGESSRSCAPNPVSAPVIKTTWSDTKLLFLEVMARVQILVYGSDDR